MDGDTSLSRRDATLASLNDGSASHAERGYVAGTVFAKEGWRVASPTGLEPEPTTLASYVSIRGASALARWRTDEHPLSGP